MAESEPDAFDELRATLEQAAARKPWIGDHGFNVLEAWECTHSFYWFREEADMRNAVALLERANREASADCDYEPFDAVSWFGPIEDLMHGRHEVAESARFWFWASLERFAWPFTLEADEGWSMFLVRPVSEEDLVAFGEFLADPGPLCAVPWDWG